MNRREQITCLAILFDGSTRSLGKDGSECLAGSSGTGYIAEGIETGQQGHGAGK